MNKSRLQNPAQAGAPAPGAHSVLGRAPPTDSFCFAKRIKTVGDHARTWPRGGALRESAVTGAHHWPVLKWAVGGGLIAVLSGCATIYNPATQRQETVLDTSVEMALGNLARAQMGLGSLKVGQATADQMNRVQQIGQRIAAVSDRQDVPYQFGVVRDETPNAFTLPGGTIYVHTGILDRATDDDELAAVIAHEVGHVAARHAAKHLQADLGFTALLHLAHAAGVGAESAQVADSMYELFRRGYSRQDELEADRLSIRYTDRAGFDPRGLLRFFEKIEVEEPPNPLDRAFEWQSTHPLTSDRIAQAKEELAQLEGQTFCPTCGQTYEAKRKFCERDGTPLKIKKGTPLPSSSLSPPRGEKERMRGEGGWHP